MRMLGQVVATLLLYSVSFQAAAAGSLVKLWELDLSKWNNSRGRRNADNFPVAALSFSPDEKRIALTGTEKKEEDGKLRGLLLIVGIGAPGVDAKSFEAAPMSTFLEWSPSGDAVVVNDLLVRLDAGMSCTVPNTSGFISEDQLIAYKRAGPTRSSTRVTVYDKNCRPGKEWETSQRWNILDISMDRRLLLMNKHLEENLLVTPDDGRVVRRWSVGAWPVWDGPGGKFADNGAALCNELSVDDAPKGKTLRCWNTDTGELIGNAPADYATGPFVTSRGSTRVVFSEAGHMRGLVPDWDTHPYKGAVVWDYATGERLASWRPQTQTWIELGLRPPKKITEPSKFAISADGQFIAEGGNGKLTVYRVQP